jgi:peptidoglycan-associated lipoprotein
VVPPAATPAPAAKPEQFVESPSLRDAYFDFDKYAIRPDAAAALDADAAWLKSNPDVKIVIEGHCDERGTNEYNIVLGDNRARGTRDYLMAHGVAADRMTTVSYGEERPVCTERNEGCWAKNRRAHFLARRR